VKKECAGFVQYATDIRDIFAVPAALNLIEKKEDWCRI